MPVAVGIDLGTTYSCVAALINGKVEVITSSDYSLRTEPSCVAFVDGENEPLVGEAARSQAAMNPANTIFESKRLIGRKFEEQSVQEYVKRWPFEVTNKSGDPVFNVVHNDDAKEFSPQEISTMVLRKLKASAENLLRHPVTEAVVTVPAYFNDSQRRATREAAEKAGLRVLRLVPEHTAAALAYNLERQTAGEKNVLVYDLEGDTFEVTVFTVSECHFVVRANSQLGGSDFDRIIVKFAKKEAQRKLQEDVFGNASKMSPICERVKRDLSAMTSRTALDLEPIVLEEISIPLTQAKFEKLCKDFVTSTVETVKKTVDDSKISPDKIDEVILVGGSTRMPCVEGLLSEVFPGWPICKTINADEAVAHGAALWAAFLSGDETPFLRGLEVHGVTPLSIGIESGGEYFVVIPLKTAIPVRKECKQLTVADNQSSVSIKVYQGERLVAKRNKFIGELKLKNLPPSPAGLQLDVALDIDADGILSVAAKVASSDDWKVRPLRLNDITEKEIKSHLQDTVLYKEEDQRELERLKKRFELGMYLFENKEKAPEKVKPAFGDAESWWRNNPEATVDAITSKLKDIRTRMTKAANV